MYQRFEAGKMSGVFLPKLPAPIIRRRSNEPSPALAIEVRSALSRLGAKHRKKICDMFHGMFHAVGWLRIAAERNAG